MPSPLTTTHRLHRTATPCLAALLALCLLAAPGPTLAKRNKSEAAQSTTPKKKGVSKITYQRSPSEESPAQRDKRLRRECKGMHNAGACQGYTR